MTDEKAKLLRYEFLFTCKQGRGGCSAEMKDHEDGDWIVATEALAVIAELEAELVDLKDQLFEERMGEDI